jgi:hypothetical protein
MGLSGKVGRPYQVADIDLTHDPDLDLYDQFYSACAELTYPDQRALARALGFEERTIRNWRAGNTFPPRKGIATMVILWVSNGKPKKLVTQAGAAAGIM